MSSEFSLPVRVYIEDTDAGGIVYYVNYLKYFERARTELIRSLGQSKTAITEDGLMYVVSSASIRYSAPARLDDELTVVAKVSQLGAATMTFAQSVHRGDDLLAEGEVVVACVDQETGRPRRLNKQLREQLVAEQRL